MANILLVDDETTFVETLTKRLTKRRLDVTKAFSGQEALGYLEKHGGINIVVLDVKMPGMNGIETLTEIKRLYPDLEVIILTGNATVGSAIEFMNLGAFDYLMKPCDIDHLVSRVEAALGAGKERR